MAYNIKGKPWLIPGARNVEKCTTSAEVMEKAGLGFQVDKCELVAKMPFNLDKMDDILDDINSGACFTHASDVYRPCPNAFATYRTDTNIPLGIVKSRYEIVQNKDAFAFFDNAIGENKAIWQTAGFFGDGERIFVSAKLPNNIKVNGDTIENYLVFTNSHDGSSGVNILFIPIRIICQNTLNAAIKTSDCFIRFRHTKSVHNNITMADELLGIAAEQTKDTEILFNQLAEVKIDDKQVKKYLAKVFLDDNKFKAIESYDKIAGFDKIAALDYRTMEVTGVSTRAANMIHKAFEYYQDGFGQKDIAGTAYGAYNAVTGYYSNIDNSVGQDRMKSMLYGRTMNVTTNALAEAHNLKFI